METTINQINLISDNGKCFNAYSYDRSISADGNTIVVGDDTMVNYRGSAYIFTRSGSEWTRQAELTASDAVSGDRFGSSVSISADGNTVIVGAFDDAHTGCMDVGSAYIFVRSGSEWIEQAKLVADDAETGDSFGVSVAISPDGDMAIVGASADDHDGGKAAGSVYIFTRSGSEWVEKAKLTASDAEDNDLFGHSVAISADCHTVVVGAYGDDHSGFTIAGSAYIFTRTGTEWTQQAKLVADDAACDAYFGCSVSVSADGNTVAIGSFGSSHFGAPNVGSVYIFTRSESEWTQKAKLVANDPRMADQFGYTVSISSDSGTVVAGTYWYDYTKGPSVGSSYIFTYTENKWFQKAKLKH